MGPKRKEKDKRKGGMDKDKNKGNKEEPKKLDAKEEPMPDYDWLPKKRKPKEFEALKEPLDDGLWLWPGDSKENSMYSETFWASGGPPSSTTLEQTIGQPLKEIDKGWWYRCFLEDGPFVKKRSPLECTEHGILINSPKSPPFLETQEITHKAWCRASCAIETQKPLADCDQHGHVKPVIFVEVGHEEAEVIETIDKWNIHKTELLIPCGDGLQSLRWLGHVACTRMAFIKNEAPNKFLPLAIKSRDDHVLDIGKPIREVLGNGSHVIIDYSSGPKTYKEHWDGRPPSPTPKERIKSYLESNPDLPILVDIPPPKPPPPKKKKKKKGEVDQPPAPPVDVMSQESPLPLLFEVGVQTPIDFVTFIDWQAYDIPNLLLEIRGDLDEELFNVEWMVALEMLKAFSGAIEAMLLWFGGQGVELEDEDFHYLNIDQFQKLFYDLKLSPKPFTANKLNEYFKKYSIVNNVSGAYQLSSWGFFPILLHLFHSSGLYAKFGIYYQMDQLVPFHEKIWHFLAVVLLSNFATQAKSKLENLHLAETIDSLAVIKEREETTLASLLIVNPEYIEPTPKDEIEIDPNVCAPDLPDLSSPEARALALEAAILKQEQEEELLKTKDDRDAPIVFANMWTQVDMEVDVKVIMPHFKKWLVLGDHWDDFLASTITIYALQKSTDVLEFSVKQYNLRFGVEEIQRFLLAASHTLYNMQRKPLLRISEHSFLRTYLQDIFVRAQVAKPLYTTYEEKLAYMRLHCFRHEDPLPPIPEKKKGFI